MTMRRKIVTTGTSDLLHVSFETGRHVVVNNRPDVRFVDAHTEGDCSDDYSRFATHKMFLYDLTATRRKTGVVRFGYR